tara:strand:+ start:1529 stop:2524 length:996 start_codon:yes stop_codon:yes gene_type:complete
MKGSERTEQGARAALIDQARVLFVIGKGGVGKSAVTAAMALSAAASGQRVCVAEMNGSESIASLLGCPPAGYPGRELSAGVHVISITPQLATEEYLVRTLRFRKLYNLVFGNRYIEPLMNGILGLSDLCSVGKIMDLEWQREDGSFGPDSKGSHQFDRILVDCPSTGHGLALLDAARTMMNVTGSGPLHDNSALIAELLEDPTRSAALLVSLPEEMPVSETLEAASHLQESGHIALTGIVLNAVENALADEQQLEAWWDELRQEGRQLGGHPLAAIRSGEASIQRRKQALKHANRLRRESRVPVIELPRLPGQLGHNELFELGQQLREWRP